MLKNPLNLFIMLLGAALFMPILSIILHYFNFLPHLTEGCFMKPSVFDGLVSGLLILVFFLSFLIILTGIIVYFKEHRSKKSAKKKHAKTMIIYGVVGMISIGISFYIFGGFSVGWYGSLSIPCLLY